MTNCCEINFEIEETSLTFGFAEQSLNFGLDSQYNIETIKSYNSLIDKPAINDITLIGNKSFEDLGVQTMTNLEIKEVFDKVFKGGN